MSFMSGDQLFPQMTYLNLSRSTYVSVLTIVAFSMERFLAICHPLHLYTMSGLQRAVRIIGALWVISFLSAVPFAVFTKIHYVPYPKSEKIYFDVKGWQLDDLNYNRTFNYLEELKSVLNQKLKLTYLTIDKAFFWNVRKFLNWQVLTFLKVEKSFDFYQTK